jgi:hypothetical protein
MSTVALWKPAPVPDPTDPNPSPSRARGFLDWWLRDRRTGRLAVWQLPNPALGVWALAAVAGWLGLLPDRNEQIGWIGTGALIAWAADELLRGASPLRRVLGVGVLGWQVYRLIG